MKPKIAKKGDKIKMEKCPNCKDELVFQADGASGVFICKNCKFKVKKRR